MNYDDMDQRYRNMTPEERRCLHAVVNQERVTPYPYYSAVQWHTTRAAAGGGTGFEYRFASGTRVRAFSYAVDGPNANSAGFPAGVTPTTADTNLTQASQTISGEDVEIHGIAAQVLPSVPNDANAVDANDQTMFSDGRLLAHLASAVSCELSLNGGQNAHQLGVLGMIPGAGGFMGTGPDQVGTQPIEGGRPQYPFATNGWPTHSNAFRMPSGLIWKAQGQRDAMLQIVFTAQRDIVLYSGGDIDNIADSEASAAGVRGYTYPTQLAAGVMIHLKGKVVGPRTRVA